MAMYISSRFGIALILSAAINLSACVDPRLAIQRQARVNPVTPSVLVRADCPWVKGTQFDTRALALNLDCYVFPEEPDLPSGQTRVRDTLAIVKATKTEKDRNRLVSYIMIQSDTVCNMSMGQLVADESAVNGTLSFVSTATSTAATIVSGELVKSILSGSSALSSATRENYNNNILRSSASRWIVEAIENERKTVGDRIRNKFSLPSKSWPIEAAILDINSYHGLCDLKSGLRLVAASVSGKPTAEANNAYRASVSKIARLDEEIVRLTSSLKAVGNDADTKKVITDRLAALTVARSKIGIDDEVAPAKDAVKAEDEVPKD